MEIFQGLKRGALLRHDTYRIERVLGQGGFGITYLAEHVRLRKKVAIKEFFPKSLCNRDSDTSCVRCATDANSQLVEKLRKKFLKEAEHIAEMDSPYIVRITDVFEENGTAYYIMDYIEGESLSDMVKAKGSLSEQQAIEYITKVGEALTYIHSKRMNHLDVKPANIMVRAKDNVPILIDFGLSKQYDTEGNQTSTTPPGISHGYAPMEQYNDGGVKEFSPQTDVYSLAATLYYLLSETTPPQALKLVEDELTFPATIPTHLIAPISKAMSPIRKNRHESVSSFISEISRNEAREDTVIVSDESRPNPKPKLEPQPKPKPKPKPKPEPNPQPAPKKKLFIGAAIGVAVIVASIIFAITIGTCNRSASNGKGEEDITVADSDSAMMAVDESSNTINGHEYVDLSLPSGLKWATCNVGATSPEDYGNYYAWGETSTKSEYTDANSLTYGKTLSELRSEGIVNSSNVLTESHDAARFNWGSTWRMPTKEEMDEIVSECTWTWATQGGKNGYKVTGPNGNSIFLPAAGRRDGSSLYLAGEDGHYWGSSADNDTYSAHCLLFDSGNHLVGSHFGYSGHSVRPVSE